MDKSVNKIKVNIIGSKNNVINPLNFFKSTEHIEPIKPTLLENLTAQMSEFGDFVLEKPIYVFYHIYCANEWVEIVEDQVNSIKKSGLYETAKKLFFVVIGDKKSYDFIKNKYKNKKIKFIKASGEYEYPTIDLIKLISKTEDFKGLYIHTKGTSKNPGTHTNYWRKVMDFYNITLWKYNYNVLDFYDIAGCNFHEGPASIDYYWKNQSTTLVNANFITHTMHYAGNFWWFNSNYTNKLRDLTSEEKKNRWNAEWYIFMCKPKYFVWATPPNVNYSLRKNEYNNFINVTKKIVNDI